MKRCLSFRDRILLGAALAAILSAVVMSVTPGQEPTNSAVVPTQQRGWAARHDEKVQAARAAKHDLLLIGDSITHNLDLPPFKQVWVMGDQNRDTVAVENTAVVPVPKLEDDCYDWYARHANVLKIKDEVAPQVVMIGDSITHFWAGPPRGPMQNGPQIVSAAKNELLNT